ncbi:MAG: PAS domain S-box protein [Proteobacteria bacterium]|nr:PAS domain S-box protein [Pseudomonadota bacterium]MBU1687960.1 PAS domain S-box protein [Pseudomonadota bacterium]
MVHIQAKNDNQSVLAMMSDTCRFAIINDEYKELQPYLENIQRQKRIKTIYLSDRSNVIVASSEPGTLGRPLPELEDYGHNYWLRQQLLNKAGLVGTLAVEFSNELLFKAYKEGRTRAINSALLFMIFIVAVTILLVYFVTRRLSRLVDAVNAVAQGNFDIRIDSSGSDEISMLCKKFNSMTHQLKLSLEERKQAEEAFKRIFELSLDMVCIADIKGSFRKINPAWNTILGYQEIELLEKPLLDFIHPEDQARTLEVIKEKLGKGEPVFNFENRYRCKDGTYKWLEWISRPILDEGVTYAIARDVSKRKQAEEEKEVLIAELNRALDEVKTLRGIIPICSYCKKIRDDEGAWDIIEAYICSHSEAQFSHSVCPDCYQKFKDSDLD